jgi:hypothetical protein
MRIETLYGKLLDCPRGLPVIIDCGGARFRVGKVNTMTGDPGAAIIETGDLGMTVAGVVADLGRITDQDGFGQKSPVELFVLSGDDYGYYNIGQVLVMPESVRLTAGAMISGGV